jgi:hypothetical protein
VVVVVVRDDDRVDRGQFGERDGVAKKRLGPTKASGDARALTSGP